jgi:hypothetical protein
MEAMKMKRTEFINLITFESDKKIDLLKVCHNYGLTEDRIYYEYESGHFYLSVSKKEIA